MPRSAQSSLEYLIVLAFTMAILVPAIYLFYASSRSSAQEITETQVQAIGSTIVENVRFTYYSGKGSKITLEINMPAGVERVYVTGRREIVFELNTDVGTTEMVFFSDVVSMYTDDPACNPNAADSICYIFNEASLGIVKLKIESIDNKIYLSRA